jgi:hypothetical protein
MAVSLPDLFRLSRRAPGKRGRREAKEMNMDEAQYGEATGQARTGKPMIAGWRRFFSATFWRFVFLTRRFPQAVGTLECPPELEDLIDSRFLHRSEE